MDQPAPASRINSRFAGVIRGAAFVVWVGVALCGVVLLWQFSLKPGDRPSVDARWPESSSLHRGEGKPELVIFLHPFCPCSRATLEELSVLLARVERPLSVRAVFITAGLEGAEIEKNGLWRQAASLPGVTVLKDPEGTLAQTFGAATSGDSFLYDAEGRLLFRGGLTAARGHVGDNVGVDSVVALLQGRNAANSSPVFGCGLQVSQLSQP